MRKKQPLTAFVFVRTDCRTGAAETAGLLARIPEAQEVYRLAGEDCYLVKLRVADTLALGRLLGERFEGIESVSSVETAIVLKTIKEGSAPPDLLIRKAAGI